MEPFTGEEMIFEAGTDRLGNPVVVFLGCRFPSPRDHDYDFILMTCRRRFDAIAAQEYSVVFLTEGMRHTPAFLWIVKAYRTLSREYKKNVRQVVVVRPSLWYRFLLFVMKNVVSLKAAKKMRHVQDVGALARLFPNLDWTRVPPALRPLGQMQHGAPQRRVTLNDEYPQNVRALVDYLQRHATRQLHVFRRSPDLGTFGELQKAILGGACPEFASYDIFTLACLLKWYIREVLAEPLVPRSRYVHLVHGGLEHFPVDSELLLHVLRLLRSISDNYESTQMSARSLAIIWTPTMIRHESVEDDVKTMKAASALIEALILEHGK